MQTASFNVLNTIIKTTEVTRNSGMQENRLEDIRDQLQRLAGYLDVSDTQALFFAVIFSLNYSGGTVSLEDLSDHFSIHTLKLLPHHKDLEAMIQKGMLENSSHRRGRAHLTDRRFTVPNHLIRVVLENQKPDFREESMEKDLIGFLEELADMFEQRNEEMITTRTLFEEAEVLEQQYEGLKELEKINKMGLNIKEKLVFYYVSKSTLSGSSEVDLHFPLEDIFDNLRQQFVFKRKLLREEGVLFDHELMELSKSFFRNKQRLKLTDKSINLLFGEDVDIFHKQEQVENIIRPESIREIRLFYNSGEKEKVGFLEDMLGQDTLPTLQERLRERSMPPGVTILMHGRPGTGKTETIRQISRKTGREIIHVDLSEAKSMWFGESEKKVREIFDAYREYAAKKEVIPILLFNEADALFSKRRDVNHSSVAQTENAIQNILLEQLEEFEGILAATTNLTDNLDKAFERRFLYKINFKEPTPEVKGRIWQSKIRHLPEQDCTRLAQRFNLSGGQIDNIARKVVTEEVLYNRVPSIDTIIEYCEDEFIQKERNRIGFKS